MKVYISVDIEGIAGINHWDEADRTHAAYPEFRAQMEREAQAAVDGAHAAGATEVWVKDAHASARNLRIDALSGVDRLIRGWSGHPFGMVEFLDESFDAAMFVGYHSPAGSDANPLAHTMTSRVQTMTLNGEPVSEYRLHALAAATQGVPVVMVAGDQGLADHVLGINRHVVTCVTKECFGPTAVSLTDAAATERIRGGAERALRGRIERCLLKVPRRLRLEIRYSEPEHAYPRSFYPGAVAIGDRTLRLDTGDYFEVLRACQFIL